MANEQTQETVNQNINEGKKRKRSRHWDEDETRKLISKWAEENKQQRLKSCTRFVCLISLSLCGVPIEENNV